MRIAIRADASAETGLGHVRRCASLARALAAQGASVRFVVRDLGVNLQPLLRHAGGPAHMLPAPGTGAASDDATPHARWARVGWSRDARETVAALAPDPPDWMVIDHYAFDHRWHAQVREHLSCRIAVVDDLADRGLAPDLLIDHNLHPDAESKYRNRIPAGTPCCFGPRFALLAPEYEQAPKYVFHDEVRSIGIFLGGTDPNNRSLLALQACRDTLGFRGPIEVATTSANPHVGGLRQAANQLSQVTVSTDLLDLAAFFARHDLHVGAGGGATWERCCIGAPTVGVICADNQLHSMPHLHQLGVLDMVRPRDEWSSIAATDIATTVSALVADPARRRRMSERSRALVDGAGARRVTARMIGSTGDTS